MVRFHWPVEGTQHCAWVPSGGVKLEEDKGVRHITVDMELAGQNETVMSLLTVPADYLDARRVSPLGIVLGHGSDAEESWRAPLLERLACHFAAAGHIVVRYFCPLKEQRRHRIFEKSFDVAAASPYAAAVKRWVFVGYDNGARIAAGVGAKVAARAPLAGFAFLSYPLLDPAPPPPKQKAGAALPADSIGPLAKLNELKLPAFFLCGEFDRLCPGARLKGALGEVLPGCDCRVIVLEELSGRFCIPGTKNLEDETLTTILQHVQTFFSALKSEGEGGGGLAACPLPKAAELEPSTRPLPDVPESPKRAPSPELEEPEPDSPPPPPRGARGTARRGPTGAAPPPAAAAAVRPGLPGGMIPVMGPNGQPMLVPAAALAGNPAAQQQLMMMQQTMLAQLQKQQAAGGGGAAGPAAAAAAQQQMQLQMALAMQQMAAAQRAAGAAVGAAPGVNPTALAAPNPAIAAMFQQQQQVQAHMAAAAQQQPQGDGGAAPMALDAQQQE
ncbi:hypothetical protein ABPG75_005650 [Micractinium tetrahymenae]